MPVDWQVEAQPGADPARRARARSARYPRRRARAAGRLRRHHRAVSATAGGTTQTTGAGQGARPARRLRARVPRRAARAVGHAAAACCSPSRPPPTCTPQPGDTVDDRPRRRAAPPRCTVDGVVDLPAADSLFQKVGAPPARSRRRRPTTSSCSRSAPFARRRASAGRAASPPRSTPALARAARQPERGLHAGHRRARATSRRRLAGAGPRRRQPRRRARQRAPGRALRRSCCSCSSACPARSSPACSPRRSPRPGADRRRRDAALLRTRGASTAPARAARAGRDRARRRASACALGLGAALLIGRAAFGTASFGAGTLAARRCGRGGAALAGLAHRRRRRSRCPAWRDARALTVAGQRAAGRPPRPRAVVGALRPRLRRARRRRRSSTGRRRATATSSCSRPRACRRSRSTGTRCSRPCSAGSAPACSPTGSPTSSSPAAARRWRALLRPLAGELVADRRGDDGPPAAAARPRRRAGRADRRVRRLDRGVQLHLPAAGRGRRAADQRRRRHRHRVARASTSGPQGAAQLAARARASRASSRCSTASPTSAPTCRTSTACGPQTIGARRQAPGRAGSPAAPPRSSCSTLAARPDGVLVCRRDRQGLPAPARATCCACACRTAAPSSSRPCPFHYVGVAKEFPTAPKDSFFVANADLRRARDRQRRGRRVPRPDRRHEPGARSRAASARVVGTERPGHRHRRPAQGRRLQPDRRRARRA